MGEARQEGKNGFAGVTPILNVSNLAASMDYYVNRLGFTKRWDWGDPPTFGCVARDRVSIFLCQGGQGGPGTWIMIFVDDVDALYADYQQSRANVLQPPTNMPWQTREMHVADADGHRLRFGSDLNGPVEMEAVKRFWEAVERQGR